MGVSGLLVILNPCVTPSNIHNLSGSSSKCLSHALTLSVGMKEGGRRGDCVSVSYSCIYMFPWYFPRWRIKGCAGPHEGKCIRGDGCMLPQTRMHRAGTYDRFPLNYLGSVLLVLRMVHEGVLGRWRDDLYAEGVFYQGGGYLHPSWSLPGLALVCTHGHTGARTSMCRRRRVHWP